MSTGFIWLGAPERQQSESIAVTAASAVLATVTLEKACERLGFVLKNTGSTNALAAFSLEVQIVPSGEWVSLASTWSVAGLIKWVSGAPATLAAGATAAALLEIPPCHAVRFKGNCGVGNTTTVTIEAAAH